MPHLSPLLWALAPIIFFSILLLLHSSYWWSFSPKFNQTSSPMISQIFPLWKW